MPTKIEDIYRIVKTPDGKTRLEKNEKAIEAKLDLCTRIKRRSSKRIRYKPSKNTSRPI